MAIAPDPGRPLPRLPQLLDQPVAGFDQSLLFGLERPDAGPELADEPIPIIGPIIGRTFGCDRENVLPIIGRTRTRLSGELGLIDMHDRPARVVDDDSPAPLSLTAFRALSSRLGLDAEPPPELVVGEPHLNHDRPMIARTFTR